MTEGLAEFKNNYQHCVRCGQCRSVCPVFGQILNETAAPRSKVFLAEKLASGEILPGREAGANLSLCLLCQACTKECPSAVPVHKIVTAARSVVNEANPFQAKNFFVKNILARPALLRLAAGTARWCQLTGLVGPAVTSGLLPRGLTVPGKLAPRPARAYISEVTPASGKKKMRLGYFLGCATNLLFPDIAISTITVLSSLGCEVILPHELSCCGLPQLCCGETETAGRLASANRQAFFRHGVEAVVSDCASCTTALREITAGQEQGLIKIIDLSTLLLELISSAKPQINKTTGTVTYHDPCHLARSQGITAAPRELLRLTCEEYVEMTAANDCCGGGGTFAMTNYNTSMGILEKKISSIKNTGAGQVATFCPACIMQLNHGLIKADAVIPVLHPVQMLAGSLGLEPHRVNQKAI